MGTVASAVIATSNNSTPFSDKVLPVIEHLALSFPAYLPYVMILGIITYIIYRANKDPERKFTIYDFIEDAGTGKGSLEKTGVVIAMLSITWWFVSLTAEGKAGYEDALAYGGLMGLSKFASTWLSAKYGKTPAKDPDQS